jgi:hypothetical protein
MFFYSMLRPHLWLFLLAAQRSKALKDDDDGPAAASRDDRAGSQTIFSRCLNELYSNAVWKYNIIRDRHRLAKESRQSDTLHLATMSHLTACSSSNILLSSSSEPERVGARC